MSKKQISWLLILVMLLANVYLIFRVSNNSTTISSYDAGISQRSKVGQLESFWTKYTGGSKNSEITYEHKLEAENDTDTSLIVLVVLDAILIGALYFLNKKPAVAPPPPLSIEERREQRFERKRRKSTR